ncbi:MAG: response regulator transcription factor, partial [Chloroflexia bacterium]|nr:response regulator transcription factor [Chloroflexia bacterium]
GALAAGLGDTNMAGSLAELSADLPNLRAAFAWALARGNAEAVLRVAAALYPFWNFRGHLSEGRRWLEAVLAAAPAGTTTAIDGLLAIAGLAALQGDHAAARALAEEGRRLAAAQRYPFGETRALFLIGVSAEWSGDIERAVSFYEQTLARRDTLGAAHWVARSLASLADLIYLRGELERAQMLADEGLALAQEVGHAWSEALALGVLAHIAVDRGDLETALRRCAEHLAVSRALGDRRGVAGVLGTLAGIVLFAGRPRRAVELLAAARALGDRVGVAHLAHHLYYERVRAAAREALETPVFDTAWAEGLTLSAEQAIADALTEAQRIVQAASARKSKESQLSARESEVLRLIVAGMTDREIGEALFISHRTVNAHVAHIFAKLGVHSRAGATEKALRRGLH